MVPFSDSSLHLLTMRHSGALSGGHAGIGQTVSLLPLLLLLLLNISISAHASPTLRNAANGLDHRIMHTEVEPRSNSWLTPRWIPREGAVETERNVVYRSEITPAHGQVFFFGPFSMIPDLDIALTVSAQSLIVAISMWTADDIREERHTNFEKSVSPMTHHATLFYSAVEPISVAYRVELAEPSVGLAVVRERDAPVIDMHTLYYVPPGSPPAAAR